LQEIQDTFSEACQIASTITDIEGNPLTRTSNHSRVCAMVRSSEKGLARCVESGKQLGLMAAKLMRPLHHQCLSCGFSDAAAPIIIDGRHIANWLIGQYHVREVNEKRIVEYSQEIGVDSDDMVRAFQAMPKMSLSQFEKILSFLWQMANEISRMGYKNLIERQQTDELKKIKGQLEKQQRELEKTVAERTAALLELNRQLSGEIEQKTRIQEKQTRLIAAMENTVEAIVITDVKGSIIYANPAFSKITGYSIDEVMGKNPRILKSGYHDDEFYRDFWKTIKSGRVWGGRFKNKKKDGTLYYEDSSVSSAKNSKGAIVNFIAVKRDVTKELEMERQLRQAQKLQSIGQLAAGIAHEINTPMQFIGTNMEFFEEASQGMAELTEAIHEVMASSPPAVSEKLRTIFEKTDWEYHMEEIPAAIEQSKDGLSRVSSIVQAMKEFSHPSSKEKESVVVNSIIETTILVSRNEWKYVSDVTTDLAQDLPAVPCLVDELGQVILNLLVNAAHAIGEKLGENPGDAKGKIHISTRVVDSFVEIAISDDGTGIPLEIRDKIFDPFFTTKEVGKGTGQGLAISHDVITKKHDGTLTFETEEGKGTVFIIRLPVT
jgi:PAS domain S-box-containing protein